MNSPALSSGILLYAISGATMAMTPIHPAGALGVALLWETFQRPLKKKIPKAFPDGEQQDTLGGAALDIATTMGVFFAVRALRKA